MQPIVFHRLRQFLPQLDGLETDGLHGRFDIGILLLSQRQACNHLHQRRPQGSGMSRRRSPSGRGGSGCHLLQERDPFAALSPFADQRSAVS